MENKWERIFDSPKYLKRFLKEYIQLRSNMDGGHELNQNFSVGWGLGESHYNHMLFSTLESIDSDFNLFLYDFETLLKCPELKITKYERKYLNAWMDGYTEQAIGDYFNVKRESVNGRLISVCNKLIKIWGDNNATKKFVY